MQTLYVIRQNNSPLTHEHKYNWNSIIYTVLSEHSVTAIIIESLSTWSSVRTALAI
jgi:hypothetical protein